MMDRHDMHGDGWGWAWIFGLAFMVAIVVLVAIGPVNAPRAARGVVLPG
jgi:hypothetical protein